MPATALDTAGLQVPDAIPGVQKVDAEALIGLMSDEVGLLLIDSRIKSDRIHGYIEGSVSLPDIETSCLALQNIAPSHNKALLFYCNGVKCGRSVRAVRIAELCGYTNLHWFRGGFEEWLRKASRFSRTDPAQRSSSCASVRKPTFPWS